MTNTRMGGVIYFYCDECDAELDTGETEFHEALRVKKQENWGSRKDEHGEWMDVCDECRGHR